MKGFKKESKDELRTSFRRAKKSTASLGNFDKEVDGEKKEKIGQRGFSLSFEHFIALFEEMLWLEFYQMFRNFS